MSKCEHENHPDGLYILYIYSLKDVRKLRANKTRFVSPVEIPRTFVCETIRTCNIHVCVYIFTKTTRDRANPRAPGTRCTYAQRWRADVLPTTTRTSLRGTRAAAAAISYHRNNFIDSRYLRRLRLSRRDSRSNGTIVLVIIVTADTFARDACNTHTHTRTHSKRHSYYLTDAHTVTIRHSHTALYTKNYIIHACKNIHCARTRKPPARKKYTHIRTNKIQHMYV